MSNHLIVGACMLFRLLLCFLLSFGLYGKWSLKKFITKQETKYLRFLSHDGKLTFFQSFSGKLTLTKNFINKSILQGKPDTQYLITSTPTRKKILLTANENFNTYYNVLKPLKIYWLDWDSDKPIYLTEGLSPQLHLNDTWVSYLDPSDDKLHFISLEDSTLSFALPFKLPLFPYFIPHVYMKSSNEIYYSALNKEGLALIRKFSEKKIITFFRSSKPFSRLEFCPLEKNLIIGDFPLDQGKGGSSIYTVNLQNNIQQKIYNSSLSDLGQLTCLEKASHVFFIKTFFQNNQLAFKKTDLALLNLDTGKTEKITELSYVTQFFVMDGRILIPYRGEYFLLEDIL